MPYQVNALRSTCDIQLCIPAFALAGLRGVDAFALAFLVEEVRLGDAFIAAFLRLELVALALALGAGFNAFAVAFKVIHVLLQ